MLGREEIKDEAVLVGVFEINGGEERLVVIKQCFRYGRSR
jgi:hypothetical protein